ncbi:hypothetical protein NLJ89_g10304 [Agrocybe chaxingu]|uniref:Cytochrome P450 n=1 Tax=Agrocybe chaxingu TaxID=84603 RepID=A0A9W8JYF2_9AGAR|nr:hypothetical protein NLJ89_g10304 [Agrocybe chaxingu]
MFQAFAAIVCLVSALLYYYRGRTSKPPLPPGPKPLPVVGNLHQVPREKQYKVFQEWARVYGPVVYFRVFRQDFVILNSVKSIVDLFEKRSGKYSTRPRFVMVDELLGRKYNSVLFMKHGQKLKKARQYMHRWLSQKNLETYMPLQYSASCQLLKRLLEDPERFTEHVRTAAGSIIHRATYGIKCKPDDDPFLAMSDEVIRITAIGSRPGWLVDSFPFLRFMPSFLPGAGFRRWAQRSRKTLDLLASSPYKWTQDQVVNGSPPPCFVGDQLKQDGQDARGHFDEDTLITAAATLTTAGIETVVPTLRAFFLMMVVYPEVRLRAQKEVDAVVGPYRLATIEDRPSMPYIVCMVKELLRWNVTVHIAPHSLDEDDIYEGYLIPKGACVAANVWGILNDPLVYQDPDVFNPGRFDPALGDKAEMDPLPLAFLIGMGRRFCPGSHYSLSFLFLTIAHILSVFDILPPLDKNGEEFIPPVVFEDLHIRRLAPFKCRIVPRNTEKVELVNNVFGTLDQVLCQ